MRRFIGVFCLFSAINVYADFDQQRQSLPNDPYFFEQWNLHNEGPFRNQDGKGRVNGSDSAHVLSAWQLLLEQQPTTQWSDLGSGIRIAIIDDGFDLHHEDLAGKFVATKNFGDQVIDGNLFSQSPRNFHGTLVTGIAAAKADNGLGIAGVCPGCSLIAARISSKTPEGMTASEYYRKVFDWVLAQKPDVINCSWGPDTGTDVFFSELMSRLQTTGRQGKGIVLVAAAGNDGALLDENPMARHPYTITVGASSSSGERQTYSRYGQGLDLLSPSSAGAGAPRNYIDRIFTTDNYLEPPCLKPGKQPSSGCSDQAGWTPQTPMAGGDGWTGKYSYRFSHTSAAAPLVSGVVALMLSANPDLTSQEIQSILQHTADPIDAVRAQYDFDGWSATHGYGRINAYEALNQALKSH